MNRDYQNTKIWKLSLAKLRKIYALTGKAMVKIIDELVTKELERLQAEGD